MTLVYKTRTWHYGHFGEDNRQCRGRQQTMERKRTDKREEDNREEDNRRWTTVRRTMNNGEEDNGQWKVQRPMERTV